MADLANMLIIETVPLAITERFDAGVVVATRSAPRMDHDGEQLKGQQTLRRHRINDLIAQSNKLYIRISLPAGQLTDAPADADNDRCKICTICRELLLISQFYKTQNTITHKVSTRTSTVKFSTHHECKIEISCYENREKSRVFPAQLSSPLLIIITKSSLQNAQLTWLKSHKAAAGQVSCH